MRYNYLIVDSRGEPVAHGESDDGPERALWEIHVDSGDVKRVLSHEYVSLVSTSEEGNVISVEAVRRLDEEVRRNLRMPVRFDSYIYPISGAWKGRAPVISNDLSCGGISFFCARPLQVGERVQIVIPITSQPLLLETKILRQRPSGEPIPLYAGSFVDMIHEEERMVREAVFGLQLDGRPQR